MNIDFLRYETIGYGSFIEGPYGERLLTYADYTASGKCLRFLENYFLQLSETYGNTHTEDDYTGKHTTSLYNDAVRKIKKAVGANENFSVIPIGTGATGAIEKLSKILGIYKSPEYCRKRVEYLNQPQFSNHEKAIIGQFDTRFQSTRPVVFISSYEHHSNELLWREGHAEVVKIGLDHKGLFDLHSLRKQVSNPIYKNRLKLGSFSAASNVTGIKTPVYEVARIMHQHGGYVFFDFAASGPYVDINLTKDSELYIDGIYLSMHKFLGGPGSTGLLILNNKLYNRSNPPSTAGGGTVKFVTENYQEYWQEIDRRETAGTPGIVQLMRAAMALEVKKQIGIPTIEAIELQYITKAMAELKKIENIEVLGNHDPSKRLPILSFNIRYKQGYLHYGFVSTLLNDLFGIQSRAGCACAGPYGILLMRINDKKLEKIKSAVHNGILAIKPGWVRINFHYTLDQATFNYIIEALAFIAQHGHAFLEDYTLNPSTGTWHHHKSSFKPATLQISEAMKMKRANLKSDKKQFDRYYNKYLKEANKLRSSLTVNPNSHKLFGKDTMPEIAWFYYTNCTS